MSISAATVKELREKTGAGMMDCKKALAENNGDMEAAVDWLRKKGLSAAAKKSGRVAADGLVAVHSRDNEGVLLEVNAETDFVARNEHFQKFVLNTVEQVYNTGGDIEALKNAEMNGRTVGDTLTDLIATIGENMTIRRAQHVKVSEGVVAQYVHNATAEGLGQIGVLVGIQTTATVDEAHALGKKIAMHIAASNPLALSEADVDAAVVEKERNFALEKAREAGRPENIIEKMVEGHVRKFLSESVLLSQPFVMEPKISIAEFLERESKVLGTEVSISSFACFRLGEGIEKKEDDFAAEVASMAK